ncbi:MAG TPA: HAD-IA family hydrolase [Solirubrobacteraceae bacterium]|nr:HAD-IA family hydrolase [Solirubrobacteraceae bacterium]
MKPQLVIFDCDGVLVDSESISSTVLAQTLTSCGLPTTTADARRDYEGLLLRDIDARARAKLGGALADDWLERFQAERARVFRRELEPVSGAAEAVESIVADGVHVCVASQGTIEKTRLSLELTGLDRLFSEELLFSAWLVERGKPFPDLFLHAAATIGVEPSRCAVVEDSVSGVTAAVAAGMRTIGYAARGDGAELRQAGAEVVGSMRAVPGVLGLG